MAAMDMEIVYLESVNAIPAMTANIAVKVSALCYAVGRGITSMENVCASLAGREKNAILDMRSAKCQIVAGMDIARMVNVSA